MLDLKELALEALRTGTLAALATIVAFLGDVQDPTLPVVITTAILRAIDRGIHKGDNPLKGLMPF